MTKTSSAILNTPFDLKTLQATGNFAGYASIYDIQDSYQDIVKAGAFTRTLQHYTSLRRWPKMLWQHDPAFPIGMWTNMYCDTQGLFAEGHIFLNLQKGQEAYMLLKEGVVDGLSIGYSAAKSYRQGKQRILTDIDLFEVSLVTFPANESARVTHVKTEGNGKSWKHVQKAIEGIMETLK